MPMIHFLPLLPETSAPYTAPTSPGTSSASSSRSSSISYTTGPSVHSLLAQIQTLTYTLSNSNRADAQQIADVEALNREVDYLSYFISAPLSLTPQLPGQRSVDVDSFNTAIRELNAALASFTDGSSKAARTGKESRHRHKLSSSNSYTRNEDEARLRMLRRYE
ncbi:hypothetical protein BP6252_03769 [Coleophoma cylindrospora]|uniref:Uncharacterized protein n=1 Tax=Coleophoma cylindrospora TaxID=1849047 RepID=A0A3D8S8I3_9HELO|nr:hypothetical protein BP6252_03769 [Coleophoma cylindrospora]